MPRINLHVESTRNSGESPTCDATRRIHRTIVSGSSSRDIKLLRTLLARRMFSPRRFAAEWDYPKPSAGLAVAFRDAGCASRTGYPRPLFAQRRKHRGGHSMLKVPLETFRGERTSSSRGLVCYSFRFFPPSFSRTIHSRYSSSV